MELKKVHYLREIPAMNVLLEPVDEREVGESQYMYGGDEEIVEQVKHEIAVAAGKIVELDEDNSGEEEEDERSALSVGEIISMCEILEQNCIQYGPPQSSLTLSRELRHFRGHLRQLQTQTAKQCVLDRWLV